MPQSRGLPLPPRRPPLPSPRALFFFPKECHAGVTVRLWGYTYEIEPVLKLELLRREARHNVKQARNLLLYIYLRGEKS